MKAEYPEYAPDSELNQEPETKMGALMEVITGIRNVRGEMNLVAGIQIA